MVSPRSIALIQAIEASEASPAEFADLGDHRLDQDHAAVGRGLLGAAIGQRRLAERDGALQRAHQLRREALHPRIGHAGELVRQQLRGRQQVAQIVVDLRDRKAKRGEPALLMQHRHQIALHVGQFALGDADLVAALARHDDPRRAFGILVKADQARGQPPHRPHEQDNAAPDRPAPRSAIAITSETSSRLRENRYIAWRSGASSMTTSMNCAAARRRADHADRLVAAFQHDLEGIDDRRPHRHRSHVDIVIDRRRQIGAGQQPALLPHLDGDRARADAVRGSAAPANPGPCPKGRHPAPAPRCSPPPAGRSAGSSGNWRSRARRSAFPRS